MSITFSIISYTYTGGARVTRQYKSKAENNLPKGHIMNPYSRTNMGIVKTVVEAGEVLPK